MTLNVPVITAISAFLGPLASQFLAFWYLDQFSILNFIIWQIILALFYKFIHNWFNGGNRFCDEITIRALILGILRSVGAQMVYFNLIGSCSTYFLPIGLMFITLTTFHFTEFLAIAFPNPTSVKISDFVFRYDFEKDRPTGIISKTLNLLAAKTYSGFEHHLGFILFAIEFNLESWYYPEWKFAYPWISYIGFVICMAAEVIRKIAMLTAGKNFNHVVQEKHHKGHVLVTKGIYAKWRHPSYVGQFYWIVGTQIILINPLSFVFSFAIVWLFIKRRIAREEIKLVEFFGKDYVDYQKRVPSGVPFIR